jgi:hypothetical protein
MKLENQSEHQEKLTTALSMEQHNTLHTIPNLRLFSHAST